MKYDLVFEGGGAKGMVFVGALQEFEADGHTHDRLLGTSAGAITATLLTAGYAPQEMLNVLSEKENGQPVFASFMGTPPDFDREAIRTSATRAFLQNLDLPFVPNFIEEKLDDWLVDTLATGPRYRNFFSFVERGGWFSAYKFRTWLEDKLDTGTYAGKPRHFSGMTLAEFFAATGTELSLVASDTTDERMLVLNHCTAPDCPLVWAVRMSMSIPLLWPEVEWQANWGTYRDKDITGHLIVDGGLLSNFPIELFVSDLPYITAVMGSKESDDVLGFLIDESLPVAGATFNQTVQKTGFDFGHIQTIQRLVRLINTVLQAHDKMVIEAFDDLVVRLPAQGYGTTEFDMSDERREALVAAGRQAMRQFFDGGEIEVSSTGATPAPPRRSLDPMMNYANKMASQMLDR